MAGNSFSYGTTIKFDGSNYEIWSRVFMMSVAGYRKKYILEENEPIKKKEKYATWDEDNNIVMSWIMNSVELRIAPTIAYYTKARATWYFLKKTYSHATNVIKILQLEEELCNIRQGDQDLSQYFATLTAAYERLKALRPPCKHCYASHLETVPVGATQARAHHGRHTSERQPPWWPITVWIHFIRCSGRAFIHGCVNSKERYSTFPRTPRLGRREPTLHAQHTTVPWGLAPAALRTGETSGKTKRGRLPIT
ncbi:hypothetical protein EJ110_NYTH33689 [Nymphaea thermarum]|nr:hypothetical protein EJ110_NYTH33689 [Nymphaea thermarum]